MRRIAFLIVLCGLGGSCNPAPNTATYGPQVMYFKDPRAYGVCFARHRVIDGFTYVPCEKIPSELIK